MPNTVLLATLFPSYAGDLREIDNVVSHIEQAAASADFDVKYLIGSAHHYVFDHLRGLSPDVEFVALETPHKGTRAEEISHGKELMARTFCQRTDVDYVLWYDADIQLRLADVPRWIAMTEPDPRRVFVRIPYCLRDSLRAPAEAFGVYFHHQKVATIPGYCESIFPKKADGRRAGAPDCLLQGFLERAGCRRQVDHDTVTCHHTGPFTYRRFAYGRCSIHRKDCRNVLGYDPEMHGMVPSLESCEVVRSIAQEERITKSLDLGCGVGNFTQALLSAGCSVVSVDSDQDYVDLVKSLYEKVWPWRSSFSAVHAAISSDGSYALDPCLLCERFDLAVIDGPPHNTLARIASALRITAERYVFHDAFRDIHHIQEFVQHIGGRTTCTVTFHDTDRGICFIKRRKLAGQSCLR